MKNVTTSRLRAHLFDGQKIGGATSPADDREVLVELVRRIYDQVEPSTTWGRRVEQRLEALEDRLGMDEFESEASGINAHRWLLEIQSWKRGANQRLESLTREIEAGLSSLGEQVDRHDSIIMDLLGRPERRGLARPQAQAEPVADGPMPLPELAEGARRHLDLAQDCLSKAHGAPPGPDGQGPNRNWIDAARVHVDTAKAMVNLREALHG